MIHEQRRNAHDTPREPAAAGWARRLDAIRRGEAAELLRSRLTRDEWALRRRTEL